MDIISIEIITTSDLGLGWMNSRHSLLQNDFAIQLQALNATHCLLQLLQHPQLMVPVMELPLMQAARVAVIKKETLERKTKSKRLHQVLLPPATATATVVHPQPMAFSLASAKLITVSLIRMVLF